MMYSRDPPGRWTHWPDIIQKLSLYWILNILRRKINYRLHKTNKMHGHLIHRMIWNVKNRQFLFLFFFSFFFYTQYDKFHMAIMYDNVYCSIKKNTLQNVFLFSFFCFLCSAHINTTSYLKCYCIYIIYFFPCIRKLVFLSAGATTNKHLKKGTIECLRNTNVV